LLVVYLEGLLEGSEKQAVEEHLNACETCRTELEGLQTLQQRLARNGRLGTNLEDVMNGFANRACGSNRPDRPGWACASGD
jgi:anti-sigma factor RsiW